MGKRLLNESETAVALTASDEEQFNKYTANMKKSNHQTPKYSHVISHHNLTFQGQSDSIDREKYIQSQKQLVNEDSKSSVVRRNENLTQQVNTFQPYRSDEKKWSVVKTIDHAKILQTQRIQKHLVSLRSDI